MKRPPEVCRMILPNARLASVERGRVVEYLLNSAHPDDGGKAVFFTSHGFARDDWEALASALRGVALSAPVTRRVETAHGKKYIVDGVIETPRGTKPAVRTVWTLETGSVAPRLVTAYPRGGWDG